MFRYYLKLGTLSIRANPILSALMVAAIAIGIGACMTIMTVRHVMSGNPIEHKNDQLYHVQVDNWNPDDPYEDPDGAPVQVTYLDAKALLPHIPPHQYPAQALAIELYRAGGVRGVEIGTVMFGRPTNDGPDEPAATELVRLAIPRRMYTQSHIDYVGEVIIDVASHASEMGGYRIVEQAPWLRHFTARLAPI